MNKIVTKVTALAAILLMTATAAPWSADSVQASSLTPSHSPHFLKEHRSHHDQGSKHHARGHFIIAETARLLDMEPGEVIRSLRSGKTLSALAKEKKGWNEEQYIAQLGVAAVHRIDEAVAQGHLSPDDAQKLKAGLPAMLKQRIHKMGQMQRSVHESPSNRL